MFLPFVFTLLGAFLASGVESLEALAIVLAVGTSRNWRDALLGAGAGLALLLVLAVFLGPVLFAALASTALKVVIGALLLLIGLEWLRKNALRLAGLKSASSSLAEYIETQEELEKAGLPEPGAADWHARYTSFQGVLLEGAEVILIVSALGSRPQGFLPAALGAGFAILAVLFLGLFLHRPLAKLPENWMKYFVGVLLTSFGCFFLSEGLGVVWPLADFALFYLAFICLAISQIYIHFLSKGGQVA